MTLRQIIAIDPGAAGGIATLNAEGVAAYKMPEGMTAQVDLLRQLAAENPHAVAIVEKVGFHRAGNNASASATFARHCGHIEAALYTLGVPMRDVTPAKWQAAMGALPKDKRERKNAVKERMARRFPHLAVTLATADALGILYWAYDNVGR